MTAAGHAIQPCSCGQRWPFSQTVCPLHPFAALDTHPGRGATADVSRRAEVGFAAYGDSTGGKTWNGMDIPPFSVVRERTPHVARAWEVASDAIRRCPPSPDEILAERSDDLPAAAEADVLVAHLISLARLSAAMYGSTTGDAEAIRLASATLEAFGWQCSVTESGTRLSIMRQRAAGAEK